MQLPMYQYDIYFMDLPHNPTLFQELCNIERLSIKFQQNAIILFRKFQNHIILFFYDLK
jgi:hypothetical protein